MFFNPLISSGAVIIVLIISVIWNLFLLSRCDKERTEDWAIGAILVAICAILCVACFTIGANI